MELCLVSWTLLLNQQTALTCAYSVRFIALYTRCLCLSIPLSRLSSSEIRNKERSTSLYPLPSFTEKRSGNYYYNYYTHLMASFPGQPA